MRSDTDLVIREVATVFSPDTGPCEHDVTVLVSPGFTEASFGDGVVLREGDTLVMPVRWMLV